MLVDASVFAVLVVGIHSCDFTTSFGIREEGNRSKQTNFLIIKQTFKLRSSECGFDEVQRPYSGFLTSVLE